MLAVFLTKQWGGYSLIYGFPALTHMKIVQWIMTINIH